MKRIAQRFFTGTVLCALLFSLSAPVYAAAGYSDVPEGHWAAAEIQTATAEGLIKGVGGGRFGLGQNMTRAAFVTALGRMLGWTAVTTSVSGFTDNRDTSRWYYSAVETAYVNGAVTNQSAAFRPTDPITREEAAVMLVRALGYTTLAGLLQDGALPFTDVERSRGYIAVAYDMGIINGTSKTTFSPSGTANREQTAAMLVRMYQLLHTPAKLTPLPADLAGTAVRLPVACDLNGAIPISPLVSMEVLYETLRDHPGAVVAADFAPLCWTVKGGVKSDPQRITQAELQAYLADSDAHMCHSSRYESSYLVKTKGDTTTVVWYESEEDMLAKLRLAAMFGVSVLYSI